MQVRDENGEPHTVTHQVSPDGRVVSVTRQKGWVAMLKARAWFVIEDHEVWSTGEA